MNDAWTYLPDVGLSTFYEPALSRWRQVYVRGGVYWPDAQSMVGAAVVVGVEPMSGTALVVAAEEFSSMEPFLPVLPHDPYQRGAAAMFVDWWGRFYCRDYYERQSEETTRAFLLQSLRYAGLAPKPHFLPVEWGEPDAGSARGIVLQWLRAGRLVVADSLTDLRADLSALDGPPAEPPAAVKALVRALVGHRRFPYRPPALGAAGSLASD
jgi:hypothetical protein